MKRVLIFIAFAVVSVTSVFAADGDLDLTFNGTGSRQTDVTTTSNDVIFNLGLMSDGRIVGMGNANGQAAAIRYLANGALDTTFSGDGVATAFTGTGTAGALQPDGKPVVAGASAAGLMVVRFNVNGTVDTTFDGDGQATTSFGTAGVNARAVLIQPDGKIVVAGTLSFTTGDIRDIMLARYNSDGTLDASFGTGGTAVVDLTTNGVEVVFDAVLLTSGKIIIAGQKNDGVGFADFLVARFNADGSVDTTFGTGGFTTIAVAPGNNDLADSVAIGPGGKIVVGGIYNDSVSNLPAIVRLLPDGALDTTLDGDGILQPTSVNRPSSILVQPDGKFITAGTNGGASGISKYNVDGTFDTSFSGDGRITTTAGWSALAIQPDGKILAAGSQLASAGNNAFFTSRFLNTSITPTAAPVTVEGRVATSDGVAISRATVRITDQSGNVRTAITNPFGYFSFTEIEAGQTCVVEITHRQYVFSPRVLNVVENLQDLEFTPDSIKSR